MSKLNLHPLSPFFIAIMTAFFLPKVSKRQASIVLALKPGTPLGLGCTHVPLLIMHLST